MNNDDIGKVYITEVNDEEYTKVDTWIKRMRVRLKALFGDD